ncbi:MAG: tRNA (guanosine(37)-N1)-methyltransferase TrmD, partial [bacterium]|nr:tRNA (guanosine(37)-N1)-methyltransferase TrmD [bacterium]
SVKKDNSHVIHLTPKGELLTQNMVKDLSNKEHIIIVCGRYEGVDSRIKYFVDREISIGRYILMGGEVAAMCIIETISRYIKGVLGNENSLNSESFENGYYEEDKYTRPRVFRGYKVPDVLLSGDHKKIEQWRKENRRKIM